MASDFVAGCIGGAAGVLAGHPLDTVKVRLQTQSYANPTYSGTFDCIRTTVANEGMAGLYRGIWSPLVGVTAVNALTFGIQGNVRRLMSNPDSLNSQFTAGMFAGACQSVVVSPMELVKSRMQLQSSALAPAASTLALSHAPAATTNATSCNYTSTWRCYRDIVQREGWSRGLMRGFWVTLVREVPGFGVYFGTYELLTTGWCGTGKLNLGSMLMAGGMAGVASWVVSYPVDVIKTRVQTDGMLGSRRYTGARHCLRHCLATEGWRSLWRGLNSVCLRAFPTNAVTMATVSTVLQTVDRRWDKGRLLEEYLPAESFLHHLQTQGMPSSSAVMACTKPQVSITTVTVQLDTNCRLAQEGLHNLLRALEKFELVTSSLTSQQLQPISDKCSSKELQVCPLDGATEPVTGSEVSDWNRPNLSEPIAKVRSSKSKRRCRLKIITQIIEFESMVELADDEDVEEYFDEICDGHEKVYV